MLFERNMKDYLLMSSNSVLNVLKWSSKIRILPSVLIYPTLACNYDCIMCDCAKSSNQNVKTSMDFGLLEQLIMELGSYLLKPRVHFSGFGEPLVYARIREVMALCHSNKLKWSMTTNGYLLERCADDFVTYGCDGLNVSIHGDEAYHDKVSRIPGSYQQTLAGLYKLQEKKRQSQVNRPLVAINCVITGQNALGLPHILQTLTKLPVSSITFQHLIFTPTQLEARDEFLVLENDKVLAIQEFMNTIQNNRFPVRVNAFPKIHIKDISRYYTTRGEAFHHSCVLPWLNVMVYPNGEVQQCQQVLGNIKNQPLKTIINSDAAIEFRKNVRNKTFWNDWCFRCCHRHYY